jgi:uncharacterized hydrophobic protein (TIGR00271 family)
MDIEPTDQPTKNELRERIVTTVLEQLELNMGYIGLLLAATTIATIGLLQNSAAAVIGGMIISPIFWPIMGLGVGFSTGSSKIIHKTLISFGISFCIVIVLSMIIAGLVPGDHLTSQVMARTQPTLLDLFIALASAAIGTLAIINPKISRGTGVAISIALLPPLCVMGVGIAQQNWAVAGGALLLFSTNMIAIVFAGLLTFYILGLVRKRSVNHSLYQYSLPITILVMILLSIPLVIILNTQVKQSKLKSSIEKILTQSVIKISPDAEVEIASIHFPDYWGEQVVRVKARAIIPEGMFLTEKMQQELLKQLTTATGVTIDLKLDTISTLSLHRDESEQSARERREIEEALRSQVAALPSQPQIESVEIKLAKTANDPAAVIMTLKKYDTMPISFEEKTQIEKALNQQFDMKLQLQVELLNLGTLQKDSVDETTLLTQQIQERVAKDIALIAPSAVVQMVKIIDSSETSDSSSLDQATATDAAVLSMPPTAIALLPTSEPPPQPPRRIVIFLAVPTNFRLSTTEKEQLTVNVQKLTTQPVTLEFEAVNFSPI